MGVYRTYFDKNNTIIKDRLVNTGRNQVSELYFGGKVSRFLFYCTFNELKEKVLNKEIFINESTKHFLKIKNTSNFDISKYLSDDNNLKFSDKYRSSSFDLELYEFTEFWDEGMGYDFDPSETTLEQNRDYSLEPSNWFYGTLATQFLVSGGTLGTYIGSQHLDKGNEDISIDITDYVNNIISGATGDYEGFCLKYTDQYENLTFNDDRTYVLGLFTKYTQTFFEPYIETTYDDIIKDNRTDFYLNKTNRLYLYSIIDGVFQNLDELPTVTIGDVSFSNVTQQLRGIYYVEFFAASDDFETYTEYNDVWSNIKYNGVDLPSVTMSFVPYESKGYFNISDNIEDPVRYGISTSGIKHNDKLYQGEYKKVFVNLRKPYTVADKDVISNVYYKLYIKQGKNIVTILDWQEVNKAANNNYFNIDTTWLIPQVYYVDIMVKRNGESNIYNEELMFSIVNKYI